MAQGFVLFFFHSIVHSFLFLQSISMVALSKELPQSGISMVSSQTSAESLQTTTTTSESAEVEDACDRAASHRKTYLETPVLVGEALLRTEKKLSA